MIDLFVMILICTLLASTIEKRTYCYGNVKVGIKRDAGTAILYCIVLMYLILFAGLRSGYNDTYTYKDAFFFVNPYGISLKLLRQSYGGFELYQMLIKRFISEDPQMFIFVSAVVTTLLYVPFIAKYSDSFGESLFLFLIGSYMFSMAGIKQSMAMGICLYAIEAYYDRRWMKMIIFLILSMTIHPYTICLCSLIFLKNQVWDRKTLAIIALGIFLFMNLDIVFGTLAVIGKDYSGEDLYTYTINPIRVVVEALPVLISWRYRKEINREDDPWLILGCNFQTVSFFFIAISLFINPIYPGRMATYFTIISMISIPKMLRVAFGNGSNGRVLTIGYYAFQFAYYVMDLTKIGSISIFYDQFRHVSLEYLFSVF